jgi:hypothetical protein
LLSFAPDMIKIEDQLAAIGFAGCRPIDCGWRTARLDGTYSAAPARRGAGEPAFSRALLRWRDRLPRSPRPSPYRISRA